MQTIEIKTAIKQLNPKAFVVSTEAEGTTLYSYGAPVVHRNAKGQTFVDAVAWGRSKSTSGHMKTFLGEDRDATTAKIMSGEYELAKLVAPNVDVQTPAKAPAEASEAK